MEAGSSAGASSASEFVFLYRLGGGELSPAAENKADFLNRRAAIRPKIGSRKEIITYQMLPVSWVG